MAIQTGRLSSAEHDFYLTISGMASNTPLTEMKARVFQGAGFGGVNKPLHQMEIEFFQNFANSSKTKEGDLWIEVVAACGLTPTTNLTENKRLFFSSTEAQLQTAIRALNPVAYYPLDEQSGNALNKAPSTQGTLDGTVTGATQAQAGQVGRAYSFDGVNDYISIADNDSLEGMAAVTILFLLKQDTMSAFEKLWFKSGVYDIGLNNNGQIFTELNGIVNIGTWDSQPAGGIDDNTWRLVTQTYDGATFKGYLNDTVVETTGSLTGSLGTGGGALAIGRHENNLNEYYSGLLQHVALFNRALSAAEILKLVRISGLG